MISKQDLLARTEGAFQKKVTDAERIIDEFLEQSYQGSRVSYSVGSLEPKVIEALIRIYREGGWKVFVDRVAESHHQSDGGTFMVFE